MRERRRVLASLVIISVLLAGLVALLSHPFDPDAISGDHLFYRSMSYNLFAVTRPDLNVSAPSSGGQEWKEGLNRQPPYVYRVVTPLLARGIAYATGINTAYYLISFWALVGAAVFIGLAIYEMTGSQVPSVAGAILFLSNWWTARFNLADYMLTDPMAFFLNAIAVWALVRRKRTLFFVVCAVGLLNKETMLPMLVAYPMSELLVDRRVPRSSIAFLIGIPLAMSAFRHAIPVPDGGYSLLGSFSGGMTSAKWVLLEGLAVFGAVAPATIRRVRGSRLMVSLLPPVVACVLGAWFVGPGITDQGRALVHALPAVCVVVLWRWPTSPLQRLLTLAPVPLAVVSFMSYRFRGGPTAHFLAVLLVPFLLAAAAEMWLFFVQKRQPQGLHD